MKIPKITQSLAGKRNNSLYEKNIVDHSLFLYITHIAMHR